MFGLIFMIYFFAMMVVSLINHDPMATVLQCALLSALFYIGWKLANISININKLLKEEKK